MPETTTAATSLREQAIAAADEHDRRERESAARYAAEHRECIINAADRTAVGIFGEPAHGVTWKIVERAEDEPYDDRATAIIGGELFEFESGSSPARFLRHLAPCPSPLHHPPAEMRSDAIRDLHELGSILRYPEGRYHCRECSRVEHNTEERLDAMAAEAPEPPLPPLPKREDALRWAVTAAREAGELREELEALDRTPEQEAALANRVQAAAAVSQAWSAVTRTLQQDCLTYGVGD